MLLGLMQKILLPRRRRCANTMPIVMAAGSAGGMTMVMRSRLRMIMMVTLISFLIYAGVYKHDRYCYMYV